MITKNINNWYRIYRQWSRCNNIEHLWLRHNLGYGFIFRNVRNEKRQKISDLTKDITEYLDESLKLKFLSIKEKYKIAYHSPCSMQHGQKVHNQPINLIKQTGNEVLEIPEGHICCGSAGTYNILQQKLAKEMLNNKIENINKVSPDFISTGNIGCMTQISNGTTIPIVHTVSTLVNGGQNHINLKTKQMKILVTENIQLNEDRLKSLYDAKLNLMMNFIPKN